MTRNLKQFAVGTLSSNGRGVEVRSDRLDSLSDAHKIAIGDAVGDDPGRPRLLTRGKLGDSGPSITPKCDALRMAERHYTVSEIAEMWGLSSGAVRKLFQQEPGILAIGEPRPKFGRRRGKVTLRIPQSVLERVYRRHCTS